MLMYSVPHMGLRDNDNTTILQCVTIRYGTAGAMLHAERDVTSVNILMGWYLERYGGGTFRVEFLVNIPFREH